MPKVNYTNSKGLFQEAGSGLELAAGTLNSRAKVVALSDLGGSGGEIRDALTQADSGTIFLIPAMTGGTHTISLPAAADAVVGCSYKFVLVATPGQIFSIDTSVSGDKIILAEPDGDGNMTVNTFNKARFTTSARAGASLRITCISTTGAHAYLVSELTAGIAANTGEFVGAN